MLIYLTEEPRKGWQQISHWKQCKGEDSEVTSLKYCERELEHRILYSGKMSFKNKGEIKTFPEIK